MKESYLEYLEPEPPSTKTVAVYECHSTVDAVLLAQVHIFSAHVNYKTFGTTYPVFAEAPKDKALSILSIANWKAIFP